MTFTSNTGRSDYDHIAGLVTRLLEIAQNLRDVCDDLPQIFSEGDEQRLRNVIGHLRVDALKLAMQSSGVHLAFRRDRRLSEVTHLPADGRWSDSWEDYEPQSGYDVPRISDHAPWRVWPAPGPAQPWRPSDGRLGQLERDPDVLWQEEMDQSAAQLEAWQSRLRQVTCERFAGVARQEANVSSSSA